MKKAIPCHQQGKQGGSEDGEEVVGVDVPVVMVLFTSGGLVG